ncbi:pyridoxal 5'-phosphate synthase glutaminase subunit PdxT, partial [Microbacterium sp. BF1]|uniref:pyridoxal 5'-phosphate synthase glutaminase subunit PdxT n=1 Tax=Microbacterium sp. BF1 TaxID=2821146 RepID=UPI0027E22616
MAGSTRVGVLALQGDVREHAALLTGLGADVVLVRRPDELSSVGGLVIPGGESSVIDKLSRMFGMQQPIRDAIAAGMPVLGTCAGLIMLADDIVDAIDGQESFGGLDVVVRRNAFGRQVESFEAELDVPALGTEPVSAAFIRGPVVWSEMLWARRSRASTATRRFFGSTNASTWNTCPWSRMRTAASAT